MRVFTCDNCGQLVFFENDLCLRCRSPLGYVHERQDIVALTALGDGRLVDMHTPVMSWRRCETGAQTGCNWLVPWGAGNPTHCPSCLLTRTRPGDGDLDGVAEWVAAEAAKRRLMYQLALLDLPVVGRDEDTQQGLVFDLLSSSETKVITGHDNGVITLDLHEADDEHRERLRRELDEPYRTVLGHFRHEIGHYYWPILVDGGDTLEACRALFGDDTLDYGEAVKAHYASDSTGESWLGTHISRYATMHPYEDWAESFAHYLHILDALETAGHFELTRQPARPYTSFGDVIEQWLQLTYGLNQVNQSMGRPPLYPFVLSPQVIRKLSFVDQVVRHWRAPDPALLS
jgi:hypothetical protein